MISQATLAAWAPRVLSIVRIVAALLFLEHGTQKLFGFPEMPQMPGAPPMGAGLPPLLMAAALLETIGGALLALGLFTRPVAFILSGEMAAAYFMAHAPRSFFPAINMGDPAILYCFIFFYFVFVGAGPWSLDAMLARRKATVAAG